MTISTQTRTAGPFTTNGSTTAFPFAFKCFAAGDIVVVKRVTATGVESNLVLNTDYTVSLNTNQDANPGGTVNTVGALGAGFTLTLTTNLQYLQPTDLTNQGGFYPKVITTALDRLTIFSQQLLGLANRALKFPISDGNLDATIPGKDQRKGRLLAFHETTGLPIAGPTIADTGTVGSSIAAIVTVADNIADVNTVADNIDEVTNFNATYQGPKATDPTTRNDGSPLMEGDLYFNTNTDRLRVYTGSRWSEANTGAVSVQRFTGDGTTVSFQLNAAPDNENVVQAFIGGIYQSKTEYDITGSNADILTFTAAPPNGAGIEVVTFSVLPLGVVDASQVQMAGGGTLDELANTDSGILVAGVEAAYIGAIATDHVDIMRHLPKNLWNAIRNHTNTVDLTTYMTEAHSLGKIVTYPAGKFRFSRLTIPAGGIIGEYKNTVLDSFDTSSNHLITHQGLDPKGLLVNELGAYFRDFYLRVDSIAQKASGAGIFINSGATNENYTSYVGGVTVRNVPTSLRTTNASYLTIERNYFAFYKEFGFYADNDYAAFGDNGDNIINGNSFYTNQSAFSIKYRTGGGRIIGNKINGGLIGVDISPLRDSSIVLVQGNSIENQTINAVRFVTEAGAAATDFTQVSILGNQIGGYNLLGNAIQINPTAYSLKTLQIASNIILSPTVDTNAIDVRNADRFTIANNLVDCMGTGYGGIFVSATAVNGFVVDNEVHRYTTNHTQILSTTTKERRKVATVSTSYTVPSVSAGAQHTLAITVNGASVGDKVLPSMNVSNAGLILTGYVSAANTVTLSWFNPTGSAVSVGTATIRTDVIK